MLSAVFRVGVVEDKNLHFRPTSDVLHANRTDAGASLVVNR
jgi:hypothetical protein